LVGLTPSLAGDGLHNLVYQYEKPTWSNTSGITPNKVLANTRTFSHINYDPRNDVAGLHRQKVDGGDGVPIAALAEIRDNQPAESGWFIDEVTARDAGNGSGGIRRRQTKARATTDQFTSKWIASNGRREETEVLMWMDLTAADATTIYNDAKTNTADMTGATPVAPANHKLLMCQRIPHGNNSFNVVRMTFIPRSTGGTANDDWDEYKDYYSVTFPKWRRVKIAGVLTEQVRFFTYTFFVMQDTDRADSYKWANGDTPPHVAIRHPIESRIEFLGKGRYRAWCITAACDDWVTDTGTYTDLGDKT